MYEQLREAIETLTAAAETAREQPGSYAYLPEIIKILQAMRDSLAGGQTAGQDARMKLARGLGRLVTEDFAFAESDLGGRLSALATRYKQLAD